MSRIADIASTLTGYDDAADLSVEAVHAFLSQLTATVVVTQRESVSLLDALGRVLAEDIVSPISVPPHDNSAMDGYAFDGSAAQGRPHRRLHHAARGGHGSGRRGLARRAGRG